MEENEQTLAKTIEDLNKKINELIKEQREQKMEIEKNNKVLMQRLNKLSEYNEIDDMRNVFFNKQMNFILEKMEEINSKLY